jgi:hypothetical protein
MFGRPTPTKQTRWPASSRAAATIIISDFENVAPAADGPAPAAGLAPRGSLIGRPRSRPSRMALEPEGRRRRPVRPRAFSMYSARPLDSVDPFIQPGLCRGGFAADGIPVAVETVVAVVGALDVRGMRAERLHHDGLDDQPGDHGAVGVSPDRRPRRPAPLPRRSTRSRREGRLFLAAEQAPHLRVAHGVGPLGVDDRHVRLERRNRVDGLRRRTASGSAGSAG